MLDRQDIEAVLVKEVGKRKAEYNRCNARMASLALRLFGDERERIKDAGRANDQALEAWAKALEELNIFILSGTVPEWIAQTTSSPSTLPSTNSGETSSAQAPTVKFTNIACAIYSDGAGPVFGVCKLEFSAGGPDSAQEQWTGIFVTADYKFVPAHLNKALILVTKEATPRRFQIRIKDRDGRFTGVREE